METSNPQKPNNYLVWTILSTLFCCLPFGIVAIIKSAQVDTYWAHGKYEEAIASANAAKKWTIASVASALIVWGVYILLVTASVYLWEF